MESFSEQYEYMTGEKPDMQYVSFTETCWGVGLSVEFPVPEGQIAKAVKIPDGVNILYSGRSASVWNNEYVGGMLKAGFKLGRNEGWLKAA